MTSTYRLTGLDCAHCAMEIGQAVEKLPTVTKATVDFASQRLEVHSSAPIDNSLIEKTVHQFEPDVLVAPWQYQTARQVEKEVIETEKGFKREWLIIGFSLALAVAAFLLKSTSTTLYFVLLIAAYVLSGFDIAKTAFQRILQKKPLDETLLMTIATLGAWVLGEGLEAVGVMVFYRIGETLQEIAVHRGRSDIRALSSLISDQAHLIKNGQTLDIDTANIAIGDILEVRSGERVPVDGVVVFGQGALNTAALTGESLPVAFETGDAILSGSMNQGSLFHLRATQTLEESTVARILKMTQDEQQRKADRNGFYQNLPIIIPRPWWPCPF